MELILVIVPSVILFLPSTAICRSASASLFTSSGRDTENGRFQLNRLQQLLGLRHRNDNYSDADRRRPGLYCRRYEDHHCRRSFRIYDIGFPPREIPAIFKRTIPNDVVSNAVSVFLLYPILLQQARC